MKNDIKILNLGDLHKIGCISSMHRGIIEGAIKEGKSIVIVGSIKGGKTVLSRCIVNTIDTEKSVLFMSYDGDVATDDFTNRAGLKISKETFNDRFLERVGCDTDAFDILVLDELRPFIVNLGDKADDILGGYAIDDRKQFIATLTKPLVKTSLSSIVKSHVPDYVDLKDVLVVSIEKVNKKPIVNHVGYIE